MYDESNAEPLTDPDTNNATKFHPTDGPEGKHNHWKRMAGYNSGVYTRDWADQSKLRRMDKLAVFDAISGQLELSPFQKELGRDRLDLVDVRTLGVRLELAAFCMCALVVAQDGRRYHPNRGDDSNDDLFCAFAETLEESGTEIIGCLNRIRATGIGHGAF